MTFDGALIGEQGLTFALVVVRWHVVQSTAESGRAISAFSPCFPGVPIVLMAQDGQGRPTFVGRSDLVRFMANVPLAAVPWRSFTV